MSSTYQVYLDALINHVQTKQMVPKVFGLPIDSAALNIISTLLGLLPTLGKLAYDATKST